MQAEIVCAKLAAQSLAHIYSCQLSGQLRLEGTLEQRKLYGIKVQMDTRF